MRVFVLLCTALGGMGQGVVAPRMPELLGDSSHLTLATGLSAGLMYLGIFLSTRFYGRLADRGRVHWLLGPGLLAYAAILLALGTVTAPLGLFALRLIEGLALSAIFVAADFALGRLSTAGERARWLSFYGIALSAGLLLGPALSLGVPRLARALAFSPHLAASPLLALGPVALLAFAFGLAALPRRIPAARSAPAKVPMPAAPLRAGAAYGFMEAGLVAVFPALAVKQFAIAPELSLLLVIATAGVSALPWGLLAERVGAAPATRALLALLAGGPLVLAAWSSTTAPTDALPAYVGCICFGLIAGGLYPVAFAWLLETVSESSYGEASGAFARAYGLGSLAGPLILGVAAEIWGSAGLFSVLAALGLLTLVTGGRRATPLRSA